MAIAADANVGDDLALDDIRQAGATDVVHALHHVPPGEAWTRADVAARKELIDHAPAGRNRLTWSVVESIPVADDVKRLGRMVFDRTSSSIGGDGSEDCPQ